ncbi:RDD family protein [Streptomyces sp. cg2]|uniref:RDD family protein n=1 Tax=Streptomyces sp. cg2 TaxID=3238799 RepID=UPI0034E296A1
MAYPPTPQDAPPVGLATWDDRAYATLIDVAIGVSLTELYSILISMVGWIANFLVWLAGGNYATVVRGGYWGIAIIWWAWQWALRGRTGQSLGQRLIGIKVVDIQTREPIGPARSIIRSVTHLADLVPLGIGYIRPTWDRQRQTFADKVHHTVAISSKP